jgi:hypothetical protein
VGQAESRVDAVEVKRVRKQVFACTNCNTAIVTYSSAKNIVSCLLLLLLLSMPRVESVVVGNSWDCVG